MIENQQSEAVDPAYKQGFEHGYWMQRGNHKDLDNLMEQSKGHEQYYSGLKGGQGEARREHFRERSEERKNNRSNDRDRGRGR